jgi:sugar lactone lactonase YvrE
VGLTPVCSEALQGGPEGMAGEGEAQVVVDCRCRLGEGPLWHPDERRLYWVDITAGVLHRYDPATGEHEECHKATSIGGATLQEDGSLLLFMAKGAVVRWCADGVTPVIDEIADERESRFNDVIADPAGRVFCGTMPTRERKGRLYRLDTDGSVVVVLEDIRCSNGMGFTPDGRCMYYTDSGPREIYLFDYDEGTGEISNRRLLLTTPEGEGVPDGMTVDAEGWVWSARWDGGFVARYAPDGEELMRLRVPARRPTSVAFGGENYRDLYITSAGGDDREVQGSGAGAVFRAAVGVGGVPEFRSRVTV